MADSEIINVQNNVKSFSAAPKFSGYDMVVLNVSDDMYISSPYAEVDETKWASRSNGMHVFTYVDSRRLWQYNDGNFITIEDLETLYGIVFHYFSDNEFVDAPKDGDTISISKFVNEDAVSVTYEFTRSGSKLEASCPLIHPDMRQSAANNLLKRMYGIEYQPYSAGGAIVNPAAELGDGIQAYGHYGGLFRQKITFSSLMSSDISAPGTQESESEFPYESEQNREYKRKIANVSATFSIFANRITAEVTEITNTVGTFETRIEENSRAITLEAEARADGDDGIRTDVLDENNEDSLASRMSAQFRVQAEAISAKVSSEGGNSGSFGWNLTDHDWTLTSSGINVFVANNRGVYVKGNGEFTGTITASGGTIGGFTIGQRSLWNSIENFGDTETLTGVHVGLTGIQLGQKFKVTNAGKVTASDLTLTGGSIKLGDDGTEDHNPIFQVTSSGQVTMKRGSIKLGDDGTESHNPVFSVNNNGAVVASNLKLTGGQITLGDDGTESHNPVFRVTNSGAVTASNLNITGGRISIGSNFSVDAQGNLTAVTGRFSGTVYAGNIVAGGSGANTTMNGSLLTPSSLNADSLLQASTLTGDGGAIKAGSIGNVGGGALSAAAISDLGGGAQAKRVFNNGETASYIYASLGSITTLGTTTLSVDNQFNFMRSRVISKSISYASGGDITGSISSVTVATPDGGSTWASQVSNIGFTARTSSVYVLGYA